MTTWWKPVQVATDAALEDLDENTVQAMLEAGYEPETDENGRRYITQVGDAMECRRCGERYTGQADRCDQCGYDQAEHERLTLAPGPEFPELANLEVEPRDGHHVVVVAYAFGETEEDAMDALAVSLAYWEDWHVKAEAGDERGQQLRDMDDATLDVRPHWLRGAAVRRIRQDVPTMAAAAREAHIAAGGAGADEGSRQQRREAARARKKAKRSRAMVRDSVED